MVWGGAITVCHFIDLLEDSSEQGNCKMCVNSELHGFNGEHRRKLWGVKGGLGGGGRHHSVCLSRLPVVISIFHM